MVGSERAGERPRLGEMLRQENLITDGQLREALWVQQSTGERIGKALVGLGCVNRLALAEALGRQLDLLF